MFIQNVVEIERLFLQVCRLLYESINIVLQYRIELAAVEMIDGCPIVFLTERPGLLRAYISARERTHPTSILTPEIIVHRLRPTGGVLPHCSRGCNISLFHPPSENRGVPKKT